MLFHVSYFEQYFGTLHFPINGAGRVRAIRQNTTEQGLYCILIMLEFEVTELDLVIFANEDLNKNVF